MMSSYNVNFLIYLTSPILQTKYIPLKLVLLPVYLWYVELLVNKKPIL